MSWIGGKKALRELIVRLFPLYYERYIEVFGGGGWHTITISASISV